MNTCPIVSQPNLILFHVPFLKSRYLEVRLMRYRTEGLKDLASIIALTGLIALVCLTLAYYAARVILWPLFEVLRLWTLGESLTVAVWKHSILQISMPSLVWFFSNWFLVCLPVVIVVSIIKAHSERTSRPDYCKYKFLLWFLISYSTIIYILEMLLEVPKDLRYFLISLVVAIRDFIWMSLGVFTAFYISTPIMNYLRRWFD